MAAAAEALARGVAREFRRRLCGEYAPRIRHCVALLGDDHCWRRSGPNCNSVGNLLLHLCGNLRQWILSGIRGDADVRDRPSEFAADGSMTPAASALAASYQDLCAAAAAVVDTLSAEQLLTSRPFQGRFEEPLLAAVLHVMEHAAGHAGQIYLLTKQATGLDLRFYDL